MLTTKWRGSLVAGSMILVGLILISSQYVLAGRQIVLDPPPSAYLGAANDPGAFESYFGNNPPTANDDSASTTEDMPVTIDVAANDSEPDGSLNPTTAHTDCPGCTQPSNGGLVDNGDGTFEYTPNADFNGTGSFIYEICDTIGACDPATVSITVNPANYSLQYTQSDEDFANPERGFMKQASIFLDQPFDSNQVRAIEPTDTLVWIYFRLDNYRYEDQILKPLEAIGSGRGLDVVQSIFETARDKGLKLVIRFAYNPGPGSTTDPNQANPDVPLHVALYHINQIKPLIIGNADVIAAMQTGFVGHWGEWHSSKYLHESRKEIVDALLDVLPKERMLQLRYPFYKEIWYQGPLTASEAFSESDASRIGHHNDCFLSDDDDTTYKSKSAQAPKYESHYCDGQNEIQCWKDFVAQEGRFTPIGGETCQWNPPRTDCTNAMAEMETLHWSFINNGYRAEVLDGWKAGGCWGEIRRRLGYRLVLKEASIPEIVEAGGTMNLEVRLSNVGYAAMFNARPVLAVLQNASHRYEIPIPSVDPRRWEAGQEYTINVNLTLPSNIVPNTYDLGLWLPDEASSLRNIAAYAVRFANTDVWEPTTGLNILTSNLVVTATSGTQRPPVAVDDSATTPKDRPITINVAANDRDPDGNLDPDSANTTCANGSTGCDGAANGTLADNGNGTITYTPNQGFTGSDSFVYEICDTDSLCDTASVNIDVFSVQLIYVPLILCHETRSESLLD